MRISVSARSQFAARHHILDDPLCGSDGHTWLVEVTVEGSLNPRTSAVVDHSALLVAVTDLTRELHHEDLNLMLPGITPTPEAIALYIRERLILQWPGLVRVTVDNGDVMARVEK